MAQSDFWEKFKSTVKGATNVAADFAEEQALVGKLKFEILTLKRKAKALNAKLGEIVFDMAMQTPQPNPFDNAEVNSLISEIEDLLAKSEAKRSEISQVADYFRAKTASEKQDDFFDDEPFDSDPQFTTPFTPPVEEVVKEAPKKPEPRKPAPRKSTRKPARKQAEPRETEMQKPEPPKQEPPKQEQPKPELPKAEEKATEPVENVAPKSEPPKRTRTTSSSTRRPRSKSPSSRSRSSARRGSPKTEDKAENKPVENGEKPAPAKMNVSEAKPEPQDNKTPDAQE